MVVIDLNVAPIQHDVIRFWRFSPILRSVMLQVLGEPLFKFALKTMERSFILA